MTGDNGMMPGLYTVDPSEPVEWADELELMRDVLLDQGVRLLDVQRSMAKRLDDLRGAAYKVYLKKLAEDTTYLVDLGVLPEEERPPVSRFASESWAEFRDHTAEEIDYLVGGLVPQGSLVFLASQPKAGKTWLALALAVCVSSGTQYLGRFDVIEAVPVLYLALEGHRTDYRTRLGCISRGLGVNPDGDALANLTLSYQPVGIDLMDPSWADSLRDEVVETGARVVFVDVLRHGAPRLREDGQGSGDFAIVRAHLQPLLKAGVTVVLVHHFSKQNETTKKRSIGEMMSGSGSLYGAADLIIGITTGPKEWENLRVEFIGRSAPAPDPFRVQTTGNRTGKYGGFKYTDSLELVTEAENVTPETAPVPLKEWLYAEPMAHWIRQQGRRVSAGELVKHFEVAKTTIADHDANLSQLGIKHIIDFENVRNSGYEAIARTARISHEPFERMAQPCDETELTARNGHFDRTNRTDRAIPFDVAPQSDDRTDCTAPPKGAVLSVRSDGDPPNGEEN